MKIFVFASLLALVLTQPVLVRAASGVESAPAGDHSLTVFDPSNQTFSTVPMDENDLMMRPFGGGHPGGGHPVGGHPVGHPVGGHPIGGHPIGGGGHPFPVHPGGGHYPVGAWHPYPGWHGGWAWRPWGVPGWWVAATYPWIWIDVPIGYWQCTAFNASGMRFSAVGPDVNQAAWGALYQCGGPNAQQLGCFIPTGYCQLNP